MVPDVYAALRYGFMRLQDAGLNNAAPVRPGMDAGRANRAMDGPLFAVPRSQDYSERIKSCTARSRGPGRSSPDWGAGACPALALN